MKIKISNTLKVISLILSVALTATAMEEEKSAQPDAEWQIEGNFDELFDVGADINRQFLVTSQSNNFGIKKITICGYKDGDVIIFVELGYKRADIRQELDEKRLLSGRLLSCSLIKEDNFESGHQGRLDEFLSVFVQKGLLPESIKNRILHKINTEKPGHKQQGAKESFENEQMRKLSKIAEVNKVGQEASVAVFTKEEAKNVMLDHVGYTRSSLAHPIIGSFGAGTSVIMGIYNPTKKLAAVAHISSQITLGNSLYVLFHTMIHDGEGGPLEVHLVSGNASSIDLTYNLITEIEKYRNVQIKSADLGPYRSAAGMFAIDSRTGEIFTIFSPFCLDTGIDFDVKLKLAVLHTKRPLIVEPGLEFDRCFGIWKESSRFFMAAGECNEGE